MMGNTNSLSTSAVVMPRKSKLCNQKDCDATPINKKRNGSFKKCKVKPTAKDIVVMQRPVLMDSKQPFTDYNCLSNRFSLKDEMLPERNYNDPDYYDGLLTPRESHGDPSYLITPRKPPLPGKEHPELRELQRELAFNNKMGINVLDQKSELQKAMEKMRGQVTKKQLDEEKKKQRSDLERELEKRAIRMKEYENVMTEPVSFPPSENEFHRIHAKVNGRFASATS